MSVHSIFMMSYVFYDVLCILCHVYFYDVMCIFMNVMSDYVSLLRKIYGTTIALI